MTFFEKITVLIESSQAIIHLDLHGFLAGRWLSVRDSAAGPAGHLISCQLLHIFYLFLNSGCHFSNLQETSNGCLLELELEKRISPRLRTLEGWTKIEIGLTRSLLNSGSIVLCQTKGFFLSETLNVTPSPHSHGHQLTLLFLSFLIHLFHCVWK